MRRQRSARGVRARLKLALDAVAGFVVVGAIKFLRLVNRKAMANFSAAVMRTVGPWLREQRIGRENIAAAFPAMPAAEIETVLRGMWDNLGRVAAEFSHVDRFVVHKPGENADDIVYSPETLERFERLRMDGKPALIFAAHLANWELPAVVANRYQLPAHVLYRRPNLGAVNDAVLGIRAGAMGTLVPTGLNAPNRLANVLSEGGHVAMLVDQYYVRGVDVMFFGRTTKANPLIARLARLIDCPIHGVRMIRLPERNRFQVDLSEPVTPVRGADGEVDVEGTMQAITNVIEGWIREHPEQWLWVHRRWR